MLSSMMTELALRAAVNTSSRDLTDVTEKAESISDIAKKRVQGLVTSVSSSGGLEAEAIGLAVAGIAVGYVAIATQLGTLKDQRLRFDEERAAGIATFIIPENIEETELSEEEKAIKGFIELTMQEPSSFSKYLGIHDAVLSSDSSGKFYSVLPFYRMSEALGQPLASTKPLDRQRTAINLFFKSALPEAIADIDTSFQTDWKFFAFWESIFQGKNYLNNRRAPRFIIMCLSNLLWNLQHPVDLATGFPLGLTRCIEICRDVELYLNQLLNPDLPPYLTKISNSENELMSFMRRFEIYVKTLRAAYVEEQLHELNIEDITNSAHQTLRIMDKNVLKLIYKRHNPLSKTHEPDDKAADILADTITYLNVLLTENPNLIELLGPAPEWIPAATGVNTEPVTIIDVLIVFCHLSKSDREQYLAKFRRSNVASEIEFAKTLDNFRQKFVEPIKEVSKREIKTGVVSSAGGPHAVDLRTAQLIVPFAALVIEDYRTEVDTPTTYARAKNSQDTPGATKIYSGKQQVQAINLSAANGDGYYTWALSSFIEGSIEGSKKLDKEFFDKLPKYQYRMTQVAKLMDSVSELVQNYRSFLLQKSFQAFLLKCLSKVKSEYAALDERLDAADTKLAHNEHMSRTLKAILRPMMGDLNTSLDAFEAATKNFERVVSAPDFTDQQRQLLSTKLGFVMHQFKTLFDDDTGLAEFLDAPTTPSATVRSSLANIGTAPVSEFAPAPAPILVVPSPPVSSTHNANLRMVVLRKLVQDCYDALSFQSRLGRKGIILNELLAIIDGSDRFDDAQLKHVVMELTRVTASYRETWFFQAAYGQTRSAKALMTAIKDPVLNAELPLASIIFEQSEINVQLVTDAQIQQRLMRLRDANSSWQELSSTMRLDWPPTFHASN